MWNHTKTLYCTEKKCFTDNQAYYISTRVIQQKRIKLILNLKSGESLNYNTNSSSEQKVGHVYFGQQTSYKATNCSKTPLGNGAEGVCV